MDKKDSLIEDSLEKLREITTRNLRRVSDDFWGVMNPEKKEDKKVLDTVDPDIERLRSEASKLRGFERDEVLEKQLEALEILSRKQAKATSDTLWDDFPPVDLYTTPFGLGLPKQMDEVEDKQPSGNTPQRLVKGLDKKPTPERQETLQSTGTAKTETTAEETREEPPEKLEDILAELHEYIGLDKIKTEVENLVEGYELVKALSDKTGIPVWGTSGTQKVLDEFRQYAETHRLDPNYIGAYQPIEILMHRSWDKFLNEGL